MRKTWLWTLIGMIGLAAVSYALFLWLAPPPLPAGFLYGNGRIEATEVTVSAEVGARVLESKLVEGRAVQANDLLVRLDETDLETRRRQAEADHPQPPPRPGQRRRGEGRPQEQRRLGEAMALTLGIGLQVLGRQRLDVTLLLACIGGAVVLRAARICRG